MDVILDLDVLRSTRFPGESDLRDESAAAPAQDAIDGCARSPGLDECVGAVLPGLAL